MVNGPLVSIQTPVFNQEVYIEETIRSVPGQTHQNNDDIILSYGECCLIDSKSKEEIERSISLKFREYLDRFYYDRAMLPAKIGMFSEAREAFSKFLEQDHAGKNILINCLFYLSGVVKQDMVNPARKLKEKLVV